MGTFVISQTPSSADLYLYPNSSVATQLNIYGDTQNYLCVDEDFDLSDNDSTYVYTTNISNVSDIYGVENHTTETGIINYVTINSRCKSNIYNQSSSGTYDLVIGIKDAVDANYTYYKSSENPLYGPIELNQSYQLFSPQWNSNPSTSAVFSWTDIDNMYIGVISSSPTITIESTTTVFRPTANGTEINILWVNGVAEHYDAVNDVTMDVASNVYSRGTTWYRDLYNMSTVTQSGITTINSVTLYGAFRNNCDASPDPRGESMFSIYISGTTYDFGLYTHEGNMGSSTYNLVSTTTLVNPYTGAAWTWDDLSVAEFGMKIHHIATCPGAEIFCTQFYIVVDYNVITNPQIRTTQEYIKVNYTPSSSECTLHKPETYGVSHSRDIIKLNTWNGDRYVYGVGKNSKTLSMNGIEYDCGTSEATVVLNCVKAMADNGSTITISGMLDDNINSTWVIKNFNYDMDSSNNNIFNWTLEAEKT